MDEKAGETERERDEAEGEPGCWSSRESSRSTRAGVRAVWSWQRMRQKSSAGSSAASGGRMRRTLRIKRPREEGRLGGPWASSESWRCEETEVLRSAVACAGGEGMHEKAADCEEGEGEGEEGEGESVVPWKCTDWGGLGAAGLAGEEGVEEGEEGVGFS